LSDIIAVSALEKKAERMTSRARIENNKPSGASFKAGLNLVEKSDRHLVEKPAAEQAPLSFLAMDQARCKITSNTNLEPKKASTNSPKPTSVKRTAVLLRHPSW
jgi:hypothetical protein